MAQRQPRPVPVDSWWNARERPAPRRTEPSPTVKQLRFLGDLHARLGVAPPAVETRAGASAAIRAAQERIATRERYSAPAEPAPTSIQLHDLAVLARRAGEAIPTVSTRGDAARELVRLRSASP